MRLRLPMLLLTTPALALQPSFIDATGDVGLGGITASRLCLADLNGDGRPDVIARAIEHGKPDRYRVFINRLDDGEHAPDHPESGSSRATSPRGFGFMELDRPAGLPAPQAGDCLVFADLDNDGRADAIFTRYLDVNNPKFVEPPAPSRTCWLKGNGDGTFGEPQIIEAAQRATTACIAIADLDTDGLLDLYLGNWYTKYGESNEAFTNDLLYQRWRHWGEFADPADEDKPKALRGPLRERRPDDALIWIKRPLAEEGTPFDEDTDAAGRPTYGAMISALGVLELSYGRRANRLWTFDSSRSGIVPQPPGQALREIVWPALVDSAPRLGLDGDADRSGKYPQWLKERARTDPRFDREDEKPFRSHGNTFDAAVGDVENDGDFDLFLAEITHAWAGPSSDRSRFLINGLGENGADGAPIGRFVEDPRLCVDRVPADPTVHNWNQGDLFCELADFDHDGRLDLLLSSGDYPDNQRLRLFRQQDDGTFKDVTAWCGLRNEGSQQISLGDVDGDGDLDILVGQSFNRLDAAQIAGRTPTLKVYLNQTIEKRHERERLGLLPAGELARNSIELKLVGGAISASGHPPGDPPGANEAAPPAPSCVSRDALGAVVRATIDLDGNPATPPVTVVRQLIGIGGHAGKQHEFLVHLPLGRSDQAERIEIYWPGSADPRVLEHVPGGRVEVRAGS